MKKLTGMLQLEFVRFKELERLTRIKAGVSADVEKRLKRGKVLEEVLKQDPNKPVAMEEQVVILFALQNGFLAEAEPVEVKGILARLVKQVRANRPEIIEDLITNNQLTDKIKEGLHEELTRFSRSAV